MVISGHEGRSKQIAEWKETEAGKKALAKVEEDKKKVRILEKAKIIDDLRRKGKDEKKFTFLDIGED